MIELSIDDDPAPDSRPYGDADRIPGPASRSHPPLTQYRTVCVVVQHGWKSESLMNDLTERKVHPPQIGGEQYHSALRIERTRCPDTHTHDFGARHFIPGFLHRALGQRDKPIEHVALPSFRVRRLAAECMQCRSILGDTSDYEIGATDVNSQDISHGIPPHSLRLRPLSPQSLPTFLAGNDDGPVDR
jgi:hypothetical protein